MQSLKRVDLRALFSAIAATCALVLNTTTANAVEIIVTVENISPADGVQITPVWVGLHSGSFDSYNGGLGAQPGLEALAEDGNTGVISTQFNDFDPVDGGYTYVDPNGPANALVRTGDLTDEFRQDATLVSNATAPPLAPGETASAQFTLRTDGSNRFLSYATMILPTNDFFLANGDPEAHDLMSLYDGEGEISFFIGSPGTANDAGTEEEDFIFSAANGLFPGRGLPPGQGGPNSGPADATTTIENIVGDPFAGFLNADGVDLSGLNFNEYTGGGIARVTVTVIPEPASVLLLSLGLIAGAARTRQV